METENTENVSVHSSSKEAFAISSDSSDSFSPNVPPISPVHIDFDDLKNDILEMENSNPAVFDQLLSDFNSIGASVDAETSAKDDNQANTNINIIENGNASNDIGTDGEASNDAVSTTSTNATVNTAKSCSGIKLVPIESLMQSTVDRSSSNNNRTNKTKTVKCHGSESSESVEELSSETTSDDDDKDDDDDDDRKLSKTRPKRKDKLKKDLKERFRKLREKAQAKRPNYAERSNSEESDDNSSDDDNEDSSEENKKSTKKSRTRNAVPLKPTKPKNVYGATILLAKLPTDMKSLLYKYDLSEIRDRHQTILASRPQTHRNEVHTHTHTYEHIPNLNFQFKNSLFLCLLCG